MALNYPRMQQDFYKCSGSFYGLKILCNRKVEGKVVVLVRHFCFSLFRSDSGVFEKNCLFVVVRFYCYLVFIKFVVKYDFERQHSIS